MDTRPAPEGGYYTQQPYRAQPVVGQPTQPIYGEPVPGQPPVSYAQTQPTTQQYYAGGVVYQQTPEQVQTQIEYQKQRDDENMAWIWFVIGWFCCPAWIYASKWAFSKNSNSSAKMAGYSSLGCLILSTISLIIAIALVATYYSQYSNLFSQNY